MLKQSVYFLVHPPDRLFGKGGRYFGCQAEELSRYFRGGELVLRSICFYAFRIKKECFLGGWTELCHGARISGKYRYFRHQERLLAQQGNRVAQPAVDRIVADNLQLNARGKRGYLQIEFLANLQLRG